MKLFGFFNGPWGKITDRCDALIETNIRRYIAGACGSAIAYACVVPASAPIAIPVAGAIVLGYMGAKTYERRDDNKTELESKRIDAGNITSAGSP